MKNRRYTSAVLEKAGDVEAKKPAFWKALGYEPFEEFWEIHRDRRRNRLVAGGGGSGKSTFAAKEFLWCWAEDMAKWAEVGDGVREPFYYWLVGATYSEVEREFSYIKRDLEELYGVQSVRGTKRIDPGSIELHLKGERQARMKIETKSGTDPSKMSRVRPHGIILCEAAQNKTLDIFERCVERLAAFDGWLLMVGTFEQSLGWYSKMWQDWQWGSADSKSYSVPSYANRYYYKRGKNDPKILALKAKTSDAFFSERVEGRPVPPKGLVFLEFRPEMHVRAVEWDPEEPVYIWEDPGYSAVGPHAHAIEVAQYIDGQIRVFDEIYEQGRTTEALIDDYLVKRPWWKAMRGPGIRLVSDPNYKDQHHSTNSVAEIWKAKTGLVARGERIRILPGNERLKSLMKPDSVTGRPGIVWSHRCVGILSEFGMVPNPFDGDYHPYMYRVDRHGVIEGEEPVDAYNDGCKATIYGVVVQFGYVANPDREVVKMKRWSGGVAQGRFGRHGVGASR